MPSEIPTRSSSSARSSSAQTAPPAVFLNPASFAGALAVFVVGSLIVKAVWPGRK